jgi:hypothetical protein
MTRIIQDHDLLLWEAYASTGDFGYPQQARIVFHCLTNPGLRARVVEQTGDKSDVENQLATLPENELLGLLAKTEELS